MPDTAPRPSDLTAVQVAVEYLTDAAFVQQWVASGCLASRNTVYHKASCWPGSG